MERRFMILSSLAGLTGVGLGAFGAHALRARLEPRMLEIYTTGVHYHLIHAVALGLVAMAVSRWPRRATAAAGWLFTAGIVLFSGSLYVLAITEMTGLGMVTPIGGVCFLAGWAALGLAAWRTT